MSDISIILDGVIALLVAIAVGLIFLVGILISLVDSLVRGHRSHSRFTQQRFFPQTVGMIASLLCCLTVIFIVLVSDEVLNSRVVNTWLDNWVLLWVAVIIAIWPITALVWKYGREKIFPYPE